MDAVSVAASIAGIISLADVVFTRVTKYIKAARNADKEVGSLAKEVLRLIGAVSSLAKLAQVFETDGLGNRSVSDLRIHQIAACHNTLDEIKGRLGKLEGNNLKRKLVWPFTSENTRELLADVSRHRENINLALSADSLQSLLRLLSNDKELHSTTKDILEGVKKTGEVVARIDLSSQHSRRRQVVEFFLKYNPQQNYEMSLRLRHPRTGLWLTFLPDFQTWLNKPDSRLWLSGIPGAGKTVLASTIIEEALKKTSDGIATAFFFCDYKNKMTQTPENVLCVIASQLTIQGEEAYVLLERYWAELHPERGLQKSESVPELQRLSRDMMKSFHQVYLVIDGLDECGDHTAGEDVVDALMDITNDSDNISAAFLSRDEDSIKERLFNDSKKELEDQDLVRIDVAARSQDVTEFVTSEIEKRIDNRRLHIHDLDLKLKDEIIEKIISRAIPELEPFRISESICGQLLAVQCLSYLQLKNFDHLPEDNAGELEHMASRSERYPFYAHAAKMWPIYAREAWADKSLVEAAASLFGPGMNTGNFKSWAVQPAISVGTSEPDFEGGGDSNRKYLLKEERLGLVSEIIRPCVETLPTCTSPPHSLFPRCAHHCFKTASA